MAALTVLQTMALDLPPMADPIVKNGVSIALSTYLQSLLDSNGNSMEWALAEAYRQLAAEDFLIRERLGEYEYQRRVETYQQKQEYWEGRGRALGFSNKSNVPTVSPGGIYAPYPVPPAVR